MSCGLSELPAMRLARLSYGAGTFLVVRNIATHTSSSRPRRGTRASPCAQLARTARRVSRRRQRSFGKSLERPARDAYGRDTKARREDVVELIVLGLLVWFAWVFIGSFLEDRQKKKRVELKQARADAASHNLLARGPCRLCEDPDNEPDHECRYVAETGIRSYQRATPRHVWNRWKRRYVLERYYKRETALIMQPGAKKAHRRCYHGHQQQLDALYCARMMLRRLQVGDRPPSIPGLTPAKWAAMLERAEKRCHYCGEQFEVFELEREHMTPLARGGRNHPDNIVPSCAPCNRRKGTMTAEEFLAKSRKWRPFS
jgi:5-methylcytosine-specific restriction endonuclease McrA